MLFLHSLLSALHPYYLYSRVLVTNTLFVKVICRPSLQKASSHNCFPRCRCSETTTSTKTMFKLLYLSLNELRPYCLYLRILVNKCCLPTFFGKYSVSRLFSQIDFRKRRHLGNYVYCYLLLTECATPIMLAFLYVPKNCLCS